MPGEWDASIKQIFASKLSSTFSATTVEAAKGFLVIADLEVGEELHGFDGEYSLVVTVVNLSLPGVVDKQTIVKKVPAGDGVVEVRETVTVPAFPGRADPLDILEARAVFKYKAGKYTDYSQATAVPVIVATPNP